jgi:hypothetical protein
MNRFSSATLGMLAVIGVSAPLAAQDQKLELSVFGAANAPLQNLNTLPGLGFKTGFGGGLGLTYLADKNFAIRADFGYVKSDVNIDTPGSITIGGGGVLNSTSWSHMMAGAELMLRFPLQGGVTPYFTTGGGVVIFKESGGRDAERAAGRFGAGLQIPMGDKLAVFGQGNAWAYNFDQKFFPYFTKVQVDLLLSAGIVVRF